MKSIAALVMLFAFYTASFGQTKKEWVKYADAAFKNGDYNSAAAYYTKALDKKTPFDITHPYEARPYVKINKEDTAGFELFSISVTDSKEGVAVINPEATILEVTDKNDQYVVHQIAESYRLSHDYQNAELWYKQSVKSNLSIYPYETYLLGDALMKNKNYAAANLQFEAALTKATETKNQGMINLVKQKIAGCYMGVDANAVLKGVTITELDSMYNKGTCSFSLNYYGDEITLQFASAREGNVVADPKKQNAKYATDIYKLSQTETGGQLSKVEGPINTNQNEGAGYLAADKSRFFFTRWSQTNKNECAIYFSRLFNGEWLIAQKMDDKVNLDGYRSTDPVINSDGTILYYSSNRPGGFGKMDLWFEYIDEEGRTYGNPINMGPLFNTAEDEVSPFIHEGTSTLYFSSEGHAGFGGLDVFKSSLNKDDSIWTAPRNLGMPINSSKDDTYFVLDVSQQNGYLSSDRKECPTCIGSACNKLYAVKKEKNVFDVKGVVYNAETNAPEANATITFKDIRSDWDPFVITTDASGAYFYELKENVELYMKAQKPNFLGDAGTVITQGLTESNHFERDFFISPIASGNISFPNVEFDFETVLLRQTAMKALNGMAEVLKMNNDFKISIESHTDISERGFDKNNIQLSEQRSKACFDYLVSLGIAPERMVAKGFGDTRLIAKNPKTEEEHQRNRRTTFSLIK